MSVHNLLVPGGDGTGIVKSFKNVGTLSNSGTTINLTGVDLTGFPASVTQFYVDIISIDSNETEYINTNNRITANSSQTTFSWDATALDYPHPTYSKFKVRIQANYNFSGESTKSNVVVADGGAREYAVPEFETYTGASYGAGAYLSTAVYFTEWAELGDDILGFDYEVVDKADPTIKKAEGTKTISDVASIFRNGYYVPNISNTSESTTYFQNTQIRMRTVLAGGLYSAWSDYEDVPYVAFRGSEADWTWNEIKTVSKVNATIFYVNRTTSEQIIGIPSPHIGFTKTVSLAGGGTLDVVLIDEGRDPMVDADSGPAPKAAYTFSATIGSTAAFDSGGEIFWKWSEIRTMLDETVYNSLPSDLQGAIVYTYKYTRTGSSESDFDTTYDRLTLPSVSSLKKEIYQRVGQSNYTFGKEEEQATYYKSAPLLTADKSGTTITLTAKSGSTGDCYVAPETFATGESATLTIGSNYTRTLTALDTLILLNGRSILKPETDKYYLTRDAYAEGTGSIVGCDGAGELVELDPTDTHNIMFEFCI